MLVLVPRRIRITKEKEKGIEWDHWNIGTSSHGIFASSQIDDIYEY